MIHIQKSVDPPPCLEEEMTKQNGDYKCGDVVERLANDFQNKCYLCEYPNPTGINVEHFQAHRGNKTLKYDWKNLFFSCGHCNNTKLAIPQFNQILNCTVQDDEVETSISYYFKLYPKTEIQLTALSEDQRVANTVALLSKIYNGHTAIKALEASYIREKMLAEISDFHSHLNTCFVDEDAEPDERHHALRKIKDHLRKKSGFRAFKSWIVWNNPLYRKELSQFIE